MPIPGITEIGQSDLFGDLFIPKFGGNIWYCNSGATASGDGRTPATPFQTIAEGIAAASVGDAISVKQGTYDESGLDLNLSGLELWLEIGAILQDSADGTVLTVSGIFCRVRGDARFDPTGGATAVEVTGNFCYLARLRANCNSVGGIGFDMQGDGGVLEFCRCAKPTVAAFKVQGDKTQLVDCCTTGNAATIGYWLTNSCDAACLRVCTSQGHQTAGFQIDTGCTNSHVIDFHSGGGDGKWTDADSQACITGLEYENVKYATQTFTGAGPASTNLFEVTGTVEVIKIYGRVVTALANNVGNLNLEFDDGAASDDITTAVAVNNAPVGSFLLKDDDNTSPLDLVSSANATVVEQPAAFFIGQLPIVPFILVSKNGATNYITSDYTEAGDSGVILWIIEWAPLTDDGFVEPA